MSILQEIRHFMLLDGTASHEDIANAAFEAAKGGHIVQIATVDNGNIMVSPSDDHEALVAKVAAVLPAPAAPDEPAAEEQAP